METLLKQKEIYKKELEKSISEENRLKKALEKIISQKFRIEGAILAVDEILELSKKEKSTTPPTNQ